MFCQCVRFKDHMPGAESATINHWFTAACNSSNSASKPASNLTGEGQLTSRAEVESVVLKFVEALNIDDARRMFNGKDS